MTLKMLSRSAKPNHDIIPHCYTYVIWSAYYSKTCLKQPLSKRPKIDFQDQLSLNAGQKYCRIGSILQYFQPSSSYHLSLGTLFCLFLSGPLRQVLLYTVFTYSHLKLLPKETIVQHRSRYA